MTSNISWVVELVEYEIQYILRGSIESQALADFVAEFSLPVEEGTNLEWMLYVDGASNIKESSLG